MTAPPVRTRRRRHIRGFSLIELFVVVVIIGVLAALAIPSITYRLRDRYTKNVTQQIENWYRSGKARAMGRGSAVLVRFNGNTVEVLEARLGGGTACAAMPVNNCLTNAWDTATGTSARVQGRFLDMADGSDQHADILIQPLDTLGNASAQMDVCFTPMGRSFIRYDQTNPLVPMVGPARVRVFRDQGGGTAEGLTRNVLLLANGSSRAAL